MDDQKSVSPIDEIFLNSWRDSWTLSPLSLSHQWLPKKPYKATAFLMSDQTAADWTLCGEAFHPLYKCLMFKGHSVDKRYATVLKFWAWYNCLGLGHHSRSCPSKRSCQKCGHRHHTPHTSTSTNNDGKF